MALPGASVGLWVPKSGLFLSAFLCLLAGYLLLSSEWGHSPQMSPKQESARWWSTGAGWHLLQSWWDASLPSCAEGMSHWCLKSAVGEVANAAKQGHPCPGGCLTPTPLARSWQHSPEPPLGEKAQQDVSDLNRRACRTPLIHRRALHGEYQVGRFSTFNKPQIEEDKPLVFKHYTEKYPLGTRYIFSIVSCTGQQLNMLGDTLHFIRCNVSV